MNKMANIELKCAVHTALGKTILWKDFDALNDLLETGLYNVTDTDSSGSTPIHWACYEPDQATSWGARNAALRILLDGLPDTLVDVRNLEGNTPLIVAVASGLHDCIGMLVKKGADLHACGQNELLPLTVACIANDMGTIRYLIQEGVHVNEKNRSGETTMHQIFRYWIENEGHVSETELLLCSNLESILNVLLVNGADVNSETYPEIYGGGELPLHVAAQFGCVIGVQYLLNHGAFVDETSADRRTALMNAVWSGHSTTAKMLVDFGADLLNIMVNGNSVLHVACSETINRLHDLQASIEYIPIPMNSRNKSGKHNCVKYIVGVTTEHLNLQNDKGMTPLMCAASSGLKGAVYALLNAGCVVSKLDYEMKSAIHHACISQQSEMVVHDILDSLISHSADVSAADMSGDTPLHHLARRTKFDPEYRLSGGPCNIQYLCSNHPSFFVLLTNGANINAKNNMGNTALHVACSYDNKVDVVTLLVIMGVWTDEPNNDGLLAKDTVCFWNREYLQILQHVGTNRKQPLLTQSPTRSNHSGIRLKKCIVS